MDYKYIVDQFDDVIFIGTAEECLTELDRNPEAVAMTKRKMSFGEILWKRQLKWH